MLRINNEVGMDNSLFFDNENEKLINDFISQEDGSNIHAILLYNLDNFSAVNDALGYDEGTNILQKIDQEIKKFFKGTDIAIRLRADEFIILVRNIRVISDVEKIAEKIIKISSRVVTGIDISATVGISLYPFHGNTYSELKDKAAQALVRGKANGKNCCRLYDAALTKAKFDNYMLTNDKPKAYKLEDISEADWKETFVDICTNLLYTDVDGYSAINAIMEMFCLYNGFERGYAFVLNDDTFVDSQKLRFSLPGCEDGFVTTVDVDNEKSLMKLIMEEYGNLAHISINDLEEDSDIAEKMRKGNATEVFFFSYVSRGNTEAGVMFENLDIEPSKITDENMQDVYNQLLRVVSYIMIYHKYKNFKQIYPKLQLIENIDACACVIDAFTHEIEFINNKFASKTGMKAYGMNCHDIFHNCAQVCDDCPLKTMDIDNPKDNGRKEAFNLVTQSWAVDMLSWLSGKDNKGKALLISVDADDFLNGLMM